MDKFLAFFYYFGQSILTLVWSLVVFFFALVIWGIL